MAGLFYWPTIHAFIPIYYSYIYIICYLSKPPCLNIYKLDSNIYIYVYIIYMFCTLLGLHALCSKQNTFFLHKPSACWRHTTLRWTLTRATNQQQLLRLRLTRLLYHMLFAYVTFLLDTRGPAFRLEITCACFFGCMRQNDLYVIQCMCLHAIYMYVLHTL